MADGQRVTVLDLLAQKARVAALVAGACAVTGLASAAAMSPTTFSPVDSETDVVATASPSVSPSDTPSASPEASESPSPEASDSAEPEATPTAAATPAPCPSGVANHGEYVSGVAHDKSTTGREHGKAVSEAAHSDCGKSGSSDSTDATDSTDSESSDSESSDSESSDAPDSSDGSDDADASNTGSEHHKGHGKSGHGKD